MDEKIVEGMGKSTKLIKKNKIIDIQNLLPIH